MFDVSGIYPFETTPMELLVWSTGMLKGTASTAGYKHSLNNAKKLYIQRRDVVWQSLNNHRKLRTVQGVREEWRVIMELLQKLYPGWPDIQEVNVIEPLTPFYTLPSLTINNLVTANFLRFTLLFE